MRTFASAARAAGLAAVLGTLAGPCAEAAGRQVVVLTTGSRFEVERAWPNGDLYVLQLRGGGEVSIPASRVKRVSSDAKDLPGSRPLLTSAAPAGGSVGPVDYGDSDYGTVDAMQDASGMDDAALEARRQAADEAARAAEEAERARSEDGYGAILAGPGSAFQAQGELPAAGQPGSPGQRPFQSPALTPQTVRKLMQRVGSERGSRAAPGQR